MRTVLINFSYSKGDILNSLDMDSYPILHKILKEGINTILFNKFSQAKEELFHIEAKQDIKKIGAFSLDFEPIFANLDLQCISNKDSHFQDFNLSHYEKKMFTFFFIEANNLQELQSLLQKTNYIQIEKDCNYYILFDNYQTVEKIKNELEIERKPFIDILPEQTYNFYMGEKNTIEFQSATFCMNLHEYTRRDSIQSFKDIQHSKLGNGIMMKQQLIKEILFNHNKIEKFGA